MAEGNDRIRIGDAERERAAEDLRTHTLAGRLSMEEYGERLEAVYDARTFADLRPIMHDLPALDAGGPFVGPGAGAGAGVGAGVGAGTAASIPAAPPSYRRQRACGQWGHRRSHGVPAFAWMAWIFVAIALMSVSPAFWPVWVLGPLLLGRLGRRHWSWRPAERR